MKKFVGTWLPYLLVVFAALFYFVRYRVAPGIDFEHIEVVETNGTKNTLGAMLQFPAIVHFYANWCGPCTREMREFSLEAGRFADRGFNLYFLSDDSLEDVQQWQSIFPESAEFLKIAALTELGIRTIPATYVINSNGKTVMKQLAPVSWSESKTIEEMVSLAGAN